MRRCCSTHATNPRRSKCRGQTRSSWMWATFQRTCHGQTFRLLSCSLFSSVCLRRSFVLTIMDLPGGVRCFLTSARTMPLLRRQGRGRGRSQTLACISILWGSQASEESGYFLRQGSSDARHHAHCTLTRAPQWLWVDLRVRLGSMFPASSPTASALHHNYHLPSHVPRGPYIT